MIEILVVLVILGVLIAMAAPNLDARRSQVETAALTLNARMMTIQRSAVLEQHDVRMVFDNVQEVVRVHYDANNNGSLDGGERQRLEALEDGVHFGRAGAPALEGFTGEVSFRDGSEGFSELVFHRNGSASQEGVIYLTHESDADPALTRGVLVERATGLARCYSYREGTWSEGC